MATSVPVPSAISKVGLSQGGCVIDAVADHRHHLFRCFGCAESRTAFRQVVLRPSTVSMPTREAMARAAGAVSQ